jgi:uncharacterized protein YjbI with pentapeptide repeats
MNDNGDVDAPWIALAVAAVAAVAPITAQIISRAKLKLAEQAQHHQIAAAYLDRALNPEVPLAMRQQLLRFLATKGEPRKQLESWATAELKRIDAVVEGLDREIEDAERKLQQARNPKELRLAEASMASAVARKQSAIEPRRRPPISAASIRAGFYDGNRSDLSETVMDGENLQGAQLTYTILRGARFRGAILDDARLQGADLRGADLSTASCRDVTFYMADLRGANLSGADLRSSNLRQAQLHGANLAEAQLEEANAMAVYDEKTVWPTGFDPVAAGAILDEDKK